MLKINFEELRENGFHVEQGKGELTILPDNNHAGSDLASYVRTAVRDITNLDEERIDTILHKLVNATNLEIILSIITK